ncbi:hypothetical protein IAG41_00085 [Sphingomonas sp. JC676]|uniref:hypothetical protein n=1 Tax=Sphingomonas sp. JC676 TaxID=2768065 RepID=UPI001657CA5E|nr:hypothetical protein [Sphingomonas sp. JC676]MBC9030779.1 hypothetical protein [Sphingomonas sp. JC676]
MLADETTAGPVGSLSPTLHRPSAWLEAVIDFIYGQLASWRDDYGRPPATAETRLTAQLCQFLNSATRTAGFDMIVFQGEVPDPVAGGRTLDLVPGPCGCVIWIDGRRHSLYDPILPIECKRLPTPVAKDRERREYLHTQKRTTGGMQRFKSGAHGSAHSVGVMIGYVQTGKLEEWLVRINRWILVLTKAGIGGWSHRDGLRRIAGDATLRIVRHRSKNARASGVPIALHHLWIDMRGTSAPAAATSRATNSTERHSPLSP